jgi:hypothetical protein
MPVNSILNISIQDIEQNLNKNKPLIYSSPLEGKTVEDWNDYVIIAGHLFSFKLYTTPQINTFRYDPLILFLEKYDCLYYNVEEDKEILEDFLSCYFGW